MNMKEVQQGIVQLIKKAETRPASQPTRTQQLVKSSKPASSTTPKKTERSVRPVRSQGSKRSLQNKRRGRDDYRYTPSQQPYNREIKRHAFEIYKDQVDRLRELKVTTMQTGQLRSMSDMVREALDNFLKKHA